MKEKLLLELKDLTLEEKIKKINEIREVLKELSPFNDNSVDCVEWVKCEDVYANDYNPNAVAPKEMELLHVSILEDGYTQPIVVWKTEKGYEVVDGFHRNRVGKEYKDINERIHGYLPVVVINKEVEDRGQRMASTIRHNRARGQHKVDRMSDIVLELKKRNWSNDKITKPEGHTWESFSKFLLDTMPKKTAEHYKDKIAVYIKWYMNRGYEDGIPDEADAKLESDGKVPSWRRIARTLLRNDYWCKGLGFSPTKSSAYQKYCDLMKRRRKEWNIFNDFE